MQLLLLLLLITIVNNKLYILPNRGSYNAIIEKTSKY